MQPLASVNETLTSLNMNDLGVVFTWVSAEEHSCSISGQYRYYILYMLVRPLEVDASVINAPTIHPPVASYDQRCTVVSTSIGMQLFFVILLRYGESNDLPVLRRFVCFNLTKSTNDILQEPVKSATAS